MVNSKNPEAESETEPRVQEHSVHPAGAISSQGLVRTFLVFLDIPMHLEFRAADMPLMPEKTVIEFRLSLRNPKDPKKTRRVEGEYYVMRRKLIYQTEKPASTGLSQYLEVSPVESGRRS